MHSAALKPVRHALRKEKYIFKSLHLHTGCQTPFVSNYEVTAQSVFDAGDAQKVSPLPVAAGTALMLNAFHQSVFLIYLTQTKPVCHATIMQMSHEQGGGGVVCQTSQTFQSPGERC